MAPDRAQTEVKDTAESAGTESKNKLPVPAVQALQTAYGNKAMTSLLDRNSGARPPTRPVPIVQRWPWSKKKDTKTGTGTGTGTGTSTATTGGYAAVLTAPVAELWTAQEIEGLKGKKGVKVLNLISAKAPKIGVQKLTAAGLWDNIVKSLPDGSKLSADTKRQMYGLVEIDALTMPQIEALFKKRFNAEMKEGTEANTAAWTTQNVKRVWKQLDVLPESDVSKNTKVAVFYSIAGGGGMYNDDAGSIELGQSSSATHMAHTVRHEVGHGVHNQLKPTVDKWLDDIGMTPTPLNDEGVDKFVKDLGDYPAKYTDAAGTEKDFTDTEKEWVRRDIETYTGGSSWDPTRANVDDGSDPEKTAAWAAMPPAVANACKQSVSNWFTNYENFQTDGSGNRLYLNHWYHTWLKMSDKAKKIVDITGENYSAMSEAELFANAYAEYFSDPAGKTDPSKWGGKLQDDVKQFFNIVIVNRDPYKKFQQSQKKKKTSK